MADDSGINLGDVVKAVAVVAATFALQAGINSLFGGQKQGDQGALYAVKQPVPPTTIFVGDYSRVAPKYAFYESVKNLIGSVQLINDGRLDSIDKIYLNDDFVGLDADGHVITVNGLTSDFFDGRYIDGRIQIRTRMGLPTETAYGEITAIWPDEWTSAARGDGTPSVMMMCNAPEAKFFAQAFPNGRPELTIAARGVCYDWRKDSTAGGTGTQRRNDESTWTWSANPVVWLVHLETQRWGLNWDRQVAPVLADLTTQANICDEAVPLSAGGTEPRYRVAGNYQDTDDWDSVRQKILMTMDGYRALDGRGRLVVLAGRYQAPDVTLICAGKSSDIKASKWDTMIPSERRVGRLQTFCTLAVNNYGKSQAEDWVVDPDEDAVDDFYVEWCPSWPQLRRLAKREAEKRKPISSGSITTNIAGLKCWGKRYVAVQNDQNEDMADIVINVPGGVEATKISNFALSGYQTGPQIDAWDPATEEGRPPTITPIANAGRMVAPVITSATAIYDSVSADNSGVRIAIDTAGESDATWVYGWKRTADTVWSYVPTETSGGSVTLNTTLVPANDSIDVVTAFYTAGGTYSPYSNTVTVNTTTSGLAPGAPTITAFAGAAGGYSISWTNPASANFAGGRVWRMAHGASLDFTTATDDSGLRVKAPGTPDSLTKTGIAAGTWDLWVSAENAMGLKSHVGPVTVVVT